MITKLTSMNRMLAANGVSPISDVDSLHPDAVTARNVLDAISIDLQSAGFWFNTTFGLALQPDQQGHVLLPGDTLQVDPVDRNSRLTRRGSKLYDPVNHTFNIGHAVVCDIIHLLDIGDLPVAVAAYIRDTAVLDMFIDEDGDPIKVPYLEKRQTRSLLRFKQAVLKATDTNSNQSPRALELMRGLPPGSGYAYRYGRGENPNNIGG